MNNTVLSSVNKALLLEWVMDYKGMGKFSNQARQTLNNLSLSDRYFDEEIKRLETNIKEIYLVRERIYNSYRKNRHNIYPFVSRSNSGYSSLFIVKPKKDIEIRIVVIKSFQWSPKFFNKKQVFLNNKGNLMVNQLEEFSDHSVQYEIKANLFGLELIGDFLFTDLGTVHGEFRCFGELKETTKNGRHVGNQLLSMMLTLCNDIFD
ncbi:hypothetical protein [Priestia aryabhattai]|uniref:hypothetical protein n=1 Tax=Priestia aryabhattai TaxID=412384 RepID=UPI0008DC5E6F|nr:hypothetical protein [Priestia aryabhattai]OHY76650.1 hypothetical protein BCV52_18360 [Priestia aryabhattai]OVE34663.1 hypothetical protein CCZ20_25625 [Priestia aryabhattai]